MAKTSWDSKYYERGQWVLGQLVPGYHELIEKADSTEDPATSSELKLKALRQLRHSYEKIKADRTLLESEFDWADRRWRPGIGCQSLDDIMMDELVDGFDFPRSADRSPQSSLEQEVADFAATIGPSDQELGEELERLNEAVNQTYQRTNRTK